ncbi:MAG: hypothetical protein M1820_005737 [Bogoriella megaspora]|nr:MAG: hypothetical protein M1820_005737 [Bogoriella megaspora]
MLALQLIKDDLIQPPRLSMVTVPTPEPIDDQILVRVVASLINPSDMLNAQGYFATTTFPRIPGRDYSGVVEKLGSSTMGDFKVGDRVFGSSGNTLSFTTDGAHAECVCVPEAGLAKVPGGMSGVVAGTIGVPYITATLGLVSARIEEGESVLVLGANGNVGSAAVQMARYSGAMVLLGAKDEKSKMGVDLASDTETQLVKVLSLTRGKGVDIVFDTVGDPTLTANVMKVLAPRGRVGLISAPRGEESRECSFDMLMVYRKEQRIIGNNSLLMTIKEAGDDLRMLVPLFERGELKVEEDKFTKVPLSSADDAYAEMMAGSRKNTASSRRFRPQHIENYNNLAHSSQRRPKMANITEEAHEMSNYFADDTNENTGRPFSLPPTDGGKAAWLFLVASFISEAVV